MREAVRDLALSSRNPVVVIPDDSDRDYFVGARITTSRVEPTRPGFRLVEFPELTPPLPPRIHDDDGMPMIPDPKAEAQHRAFIQQTKERQRGRPSEPQANNKWEDRISEADADGTPVTFRLDWLEKAPTADDLKRAVTTGIRSSYFWFREDRVLAIGLSDDARLKLIREFHLVHEALSFGALIAAVHKIREGLNPWGRVAPSICRLNWPLSPPKPECASIWIPAAFGSR